MSYSDSDFKSEDGFEPLDFDDEGDNFTPLDFDDEGDDFTPLDFGEDDDDFVPIDLSNETPSYIPPSTEEEDDFIDPDLETRPEKDVFDRVNMYGTEPTERFYKIVEAIALDLNGKINPNPLSSSDIETLKTTPVPFFEFKNPTAYVMGYLGSSKKRGITKKSINYVFKNLLPVVADKSVKKEDVVRYSILWESL